ncbi:hypothetical protein [Terasakiella sp. SH-1]|uniref:hypothetical protein n=1 Tax=Terasakiella sp. SH-1 TaxID=2560057 RepID=UPI001073FF24|nr:hypothetical protein [Terasakiella sp. SH-1]
MVLKFDGVNDKVQTATIETDIGGPVDLTGQNAINTWCRFQGRGGVAIKSSLNISSITEHGTGDYQYTYATPFANADYSFAFGCGYGGGSFYNTLAAQGVREGYDPLTNMVRVTTNYSNGNTGDYEHVSAHIIGELA